MGKQAKGRRDEWVERPSWWTDAMGDDWQPLRFTVRFKDADGNVTIRHHVSAYYFPSTDGPPGNPFDMLRGTVQGEVIAAEWLPPEEAR